MASSGAKIVDRASNEKAMSLQVVGDVTLNHALNAVSDGETANIANELDFVEWRAASIRDELLRREQIRSDEAQKAWVIRTLQRYVRGWLVRRKYLRHKASLQKFIDKLQFQVQSEAALKIQKMVRVFLARRERDVLRAEALARQAEEEEKSKKKKKKGAAAAAAANMDPLQLYMKENEQFLKGYSAFLVYRYDEAVGAIEKHLKKNELDKVAERLLERCKAGKAELAEQAKKAKAAKKAEGKKGSGKKEPKPAAAPAATESKPSSASKSERPRSTGSAGKGKAGEKPSVAPLPLAKSRQGSASKGRLPQVAADIAPAAPLAERSSTPTLPSISANNEASVKAFPEG